MLLDPELAAVLSFIPPQDFSELDRCRQLSGEVKQPFDRSLCSSIEFTTQQVARPDGSMLEIEVISDPATRHTAPILLHFHGGGFAMGEPSFDDDENAEIVSRTGVTVVSPRYRLAPENPFPAPFDDCCLSLSWASSDAFPWRSRRPLLAVMGHSAGGGLAAAVALWARDVSGIQLAAQFLLEPELDASLSTPSAQAMVDTPIWYRSNAELSWQFYLGRTQPTQYSSPACASTLAGLPRTYLTVNQVDPLRDEGLEFARRLIASDVLTELHLWPGAYHGFMAVRSATITHRAMRQLIEVIQTYLAPRVPHTPLRCDGLT